ncbi:DUF1090 domain-containing protein [Acinetobacter calcoaceticus]|uniref:DUF1090 domain-containing protein n=1 Tax=Acinetobacter calcoaceticus TaxID=471 RepID=UPI00192B9A31|nr:DUF1090 domain-containing protein [Acinetobacter calcoaceticus]
MKLVQSLILTTAFLYSIGSTHAETLTGCAAKKHDIETQLKYAQTRDATHEIKGLSKALRHNMAECDDADLELKKEQKVLEKQKKVEKIELELQKANDAVNLVKINKKQIKLEHAQQELNEEKANLNR